MKRILVLLSLFFLLIFGVAGCQEKGAVTSKTTAPKNPEVILATTTSTVDTGLLDQLKPEFEKKTGYKLKIVAVGTGQALKMGEKGEADVLLTHAPKDEEVLVAKGYVIDRQPVMHNDFILVGPKNDPAGVKSAKDLNEALKRIYEKKVLFISRGDDSGTDKKEKSLWKTAGLNPKGQPWYKEAGVGMGACLQLASEKQGYSLTDRGTYLAYKGKIDLAIVREKDPGLINYYHVMLVNPQKYPKVNYEGAKKFAEFLLSPEVQKEIGEFKKNLYGQSLFIPDAQK
ncbi:extracellular solute-binding protein [Carboxydothermus ferrireducens]|uniref:Tungstate transport system substrate-binding protein n=1 Tax=Carboxydothermus ferrireducens DSM 11255 TaxID=1119529 RepID=A0ABX2RBI5_9THEO|nr:extracellular solute-binding protein [Carboxydothermus ferrireducens]NYE57237.1 tungstate transport system substrate-binding protein [Carboxydothermus ferrireducens DSM 11255]